MPPRHRSSPPPPPEHGRRRGPTGHGLRRAVPLDEGPIDAALADIVPDAHERAFVLRCILGEGPTHHRVASWTLLRLLAAVLGELGGASPAPTASSPVPMRLPPIVAASSGDAEFPIGVPTKMIRSVMAEEEARLAVECLSDGPPHHALANAAMAWLLEAIYERVRERRTTTGGA